jgi:hypothetical protein
MDTVKKLIILIGGAGGTPIGSVPDEILWDDGDVMAWDEDVNVWIAWDD